MAAVAQAPAPALLVADKQGQFVVRQWISQHELGEGLYKGRTYTAFQDSILL